MPLTTTYSLAARNAKVASLVALIANGSLDLYTGVQPPSSDGVTSAATRLLRIALGPQAFGPVDQGQAHLVRPIEGIVSAAGTATWFRIVDRAQQAVMDGSVGTGDANLNLASVTLRPNMIVRVDAFTIEEPSGQ